MLPRTVTGRNAPSRRLSFFALLALLAFIAPSSQAEDAKVDSFDAPPDQVGFTSFPSTRTPGHLGFDGTLWLGYGFHTLEGKTLSVNDTRSIDHRVDGTLALQLGILSRGAIALRMPVMLWQDVSGGTTTTPGGSVSGGTLKTSAPGNPAIDGRVRILGAPVRPDGSVQDGAALAVRGVVWLPIPTHNTMFAESGTRAELSLITDIETFGIGAGISLGYRYRFRDVSFVDRRLGDQLRLAIGVRIPLPLIARAYPGKVQEAALIELDTATDPQDWFRRATSPMEARLSYRVIYRDYFFALGGGAGLLGAVGSPDFRALFSFGWSPRKHDQDADGVPDSEDFCVHLPEDKDGFKDEDGCADDDNDGDLIVDEDDRCPNEAAEVGKDEDEDGCTDK